MEAFDVRALYEHYCERESHNKYCFEEGGHTYEIVPAKETELDTFISNCESRNVPIKVAEELLAYYRQNNNIFNYYTCDDPGIFEWWDEYEELWLGCVDMDVFRYSSKLGKYTIGDAGRVSYGKVYEFDTLEEMLEAHFERTWHEYYAREDLRLRQQEMMDTIIEQEKIISEHKQEHTKLMQESIELKQEHAKLMQERIELKQEYTKLMQENVDLKQEHARLKAQHASQS